MTRYLRSACSFSAIYVLSIGAAQWLHWRVLLAAPTVAQYSEGASRWSGWARLRSGLDNAPTFESVAQHQAVVLGLCMLLWPLVLTGALRFGARTACRIRTHRILWSDVPATEQTRLCAALTQRSIPMGTLAAWTSGLLVWYVSAPRPDDWQVLSLAIWWRTPVAYLAAGVAFAAILVWAWSILASLRWLRTHCHHPESQSCVCWTCAFPIAASKSLCPECGVPVDDTRVSRVATYVRLSPWVRWTRNAAIVVVGTALATLLIGQVMGVWTVAGPPLRVGPAARWVFFAFNERTRFPCQ